ncbi:MAG: DUF6767 domain-containing protein [Candidatus Nanopelagicales bacterium]
MSRATAMCPLRLDQPCNLCHPDAMLGPQDCPTVAMVMTDPLLRDELNELKRQQAALDASRAAERHAARKAAISTHYNAN